VIGLCAVCEEEHELEIVEQGRDKRLYFTIYRCPITKVIFELFSLSSKKLKIVKRKETK